MASEAIRPIDSTVERILPSSPMLQDVYGLHGVDHREKALPIRPGDLTRLLVAQPELSLEDRKLLGRFGPQLGAYFHHEFYQRLRDLKENYAPLDPDSDYAYLEGHTRVVTESLDDEFLKLFESALERANYHRLKNDVIKEAISAPNELGLNYVPDFTLFEHLKVYARGFTTINRVSRNLKNRFRKRTAVLDAYQRLIVVLKFRDGIEQTPNVRSDVVYLRMFKDVPHVDMEMHLPEQGAKVKMRWVDKAQIASPLMVGLPTVAAKLLIASMAAAISPALLGTAIFAPLSAGVNSFFGFQRAKQKHMSHMIRSLYYLTLANNSSVLTRVIDSAEEEEYKETILAYFFLWQHHDSSTALNAEALDAKIEAFLKVITGQEINFEIEDALTKLFRLGLARHKSDGRIEATPIDKALGNLERRWVGAYHTC